MPSQNLIQRRRSPWTAALVLFLCSGMASAAALGCAVKRGDPPVTECEGPNCVADAGPNSGSPGVDERDASEVGIMPVPDSGGVLPICVGGCMPDEEDACGDFDPGVTDRRLSRARVTSRDWALSPAAIESRKDGGSNGVPPMTGLDRDGGLDRFPDAGTEPIEEYSCQFSAERGKLVAACGLSGTGVSGDVCKSSQDCAPGFGCAGEPGAGQCLEYCCGGDTSCSEEGHFCADRPLHTGDAEPSPGHIPVCARTQNCDLGEAFPCAEGKACTCPQDLMCSVVSPEGKTGCIMPGTGKQDEACDCAPGYFCSQATHTCLKMCEVNKLGMCGDRTCQAGPNFPEGWGLCIGLPEDPKSGNYR